jgi:hypothetical protein
MPDARFVRDPDFELVQLHHKEAWLMAAELNAVTFLKYDKERTVTEQRVDPVHEEVHSEVPKFVGEDYGIAVAAVVDRTPKPQQLQRWGFDERTTMTLILCCKLLEEQQILVEHEDHFLVDGNRYKVSGITNPAPLDRRQLEIVIGLQRFN